MFGRLTTIPLMFYVVFVVGAPYSFLGGVVLDIVFGSWTSVSCVSGQGNVASFAGSCAGFGLTFALITVSQWALKSNPTWNTVGKENQLHNQRRRSAASAIILGAIGITEALSGCC